MKPVAVVIVVMIILGFSASPVSSVKQENSTPADNYMLSYNWAPQENLQPENTDNFTYPSENLALSDNSNFDVSDWAYRRPITINNTGDALTDYQVLVILDTASLISAGKMHPEGYDIRFTDSDGVTPLYYWIESGINTDSTKIWVQVPTIPELEKTIYMYYGNPDVTEPASNGDATFIFFDDFDTIDTTKWNQTSGWSLSDGVIFVDGNNINLVSVQSWPFSGKAIHARVKTNEAGPQPQVRFLVSASDGTIPYEHPYVATINSRNGVATVDLYTGTLESIVTYSAPWDTNWHDLAHKRADGSVIGTYDDESLTVSTDIPDTIYVAFRINGGLGTVTLYIDHVFMRKYVEPEPTVTVGAEELFDTIPPSSSVLQFEGYDYWKELELWENFTVSAVAVDDLSGVENVELCYQYSLDNWTDTVAWKKRDWQPYAVDVSPQLSAQPLEDDFSGTALDPGKWENVLTGAGEASILVENSWLTIEAESSDEGFSSWVSSKEWYTYGTIEIKARVPTWDNRDDELDWVSFGFDGDMPMIRVMVVGTDSRFYTYDWRESSSSYLDGRFDFSDWHIYKIVWMPGEARLYVDGELVVVHTVGVPRDPDRVMLGAGGYEMGEPSVFQVDYVRMRPSYRAEWQFTPEQYGYYEFYSRAVDAAGNRENEPRSAWVQSTREDFAGGELEGLILEDSPARMKLAHRVVYDDDFDSYENGDFPSGWELVQGENGLSYVTTRGWTSAPNSFRVLGKVGFPTVVQIPIPTDVDLIGYEVRVWAEGRGRKGLGFFDNETLSYYAFLSVEDYKNPRFDGLALGYIDVPWYPVKVLLDKETGKADVWLNGDLVAQGVTVKGSKQIKAFCLLNEVDNNLQIDDIRLCAGYAPSGTLTSSVHDAGRWENWEKWGRISWTETEPQGTEIILQTRTSPDNLTWSNWSGNYTNPFGENIVSPGGRYIQYRALLKTQNPNLTPALHEVRITQPVSDANVRVTKDLVRVAVILAEPSDNDVGLENFRQAKERWQDNMNSELNDYFTEVSYGALATTMTIFDDDGYWYRLPGGQQDYFEAGWIFRSQKEGKKKFVDDAIELVGQRVDLGGYDIIVVAAGPWIWTETWRYCWDEAQPPIIVGWRDSTSLVAHETSHGLGRVLGKGELLPDLYPESEISAGDIDGWGLMVKYAPRAHLCSWSKEWLGWLEYEPVDWAGTPLNYWEEWVDALPTLGYRGEVYSHRVIDWELPIYQWFIQVGTIKAKTDYIPEVRTRSESYSSWDTWVPGTGLVLYEVDVTESETWLGGWSLTWVTAVGGDRPYTENQQPDTTEGGVRFRILATEPEDDPHQMLISAQRETENQLWGIMRQVPIRLSENVVLSSVTSPWPDLDLHAYTLDGSHIGVNYETSEYEIGIEGALASGDRFNGGEWIRLPAGVEAYFTVSSHDVEEFLVNNPGAQLEFENGIYAIGFRYHDERGERYESAPIGQVIEPGAEISNPVNVIQNPDGTYSVGVGLGWDMFDLTAWHFVIDNISDTLFVNQPTNRKQALKNKFGAVFNMLDVNNYRGASDKLTNDILEKLDSDSNADWIREPALVDGLETFIAMLRYRAGNGDDG